MDVASAKMIGAGLATVALLGVGIGIGNLFSSLLTSISRNPEAKKDLMTTGLIGVAFTEAIGIFALVIAILILFAF